MTTRKQNLIDMEVKKAFVIWGREVKLSQFLGKSLDAKIIISYRKKWGNINIPAFLRYMIQGRDTYKKLRKLRPQVIFVQNPPIVAVLVVYVYCLFNDVDYVIDSHTAFLDRKWIFFHPLQKFLSKRAILNTFHNYKNLEFAEKKWGMANGRVLQFYNPKRLEILSKNVKLPKFINKKIAGQLGLKVFMVNRFAGDDAWKEVIETAKLMPESLFFITGDYMKFKNIEAPRNVIFTGYINHKKFICLMEKCDVVLALTKRKDTVLWSLREIMALNKPVVTTDNEVLRHYFSDVALFSNMAPADLKEKLSQAWDNRFEIKCKINNFLKKDFLRWENDISDINKLTKNDSQNRKTDSKNILFFNALKNRAK
jgi:glycosyltransferase involved in cell wall biosynthesis